MRSALLTVCLCALWACNPSPEDTGPEALEAALSGTRSLETRHGAGAQPPPLANAGPHRSTIRVSLTLDGEEPGYRRISIDRQITRGAKGAFRIKDRRRWTEPALPVSDSDDGRDVLYDGCLLYTSPSPRDMRRSRMPSSA